MPRFGCVHQNPSGSAKRSLAAKLLVRDLTTTKPLLQMAGIDFHSQDSFITRAIVDHLSPPPNGLLSFGPPFHNNAPRIIGSYRAKIQLLTDHRGQIEGSPEFPMNFVVVENTCLMLRYGVEVLLGEEIEKYFNHSPHGLGEMLWPKTGNCRSLVSAGQVLMPAP